VRHVFPERIKRLGCSCRKEIEKSFKSGSSLILTGRIKVVSQSWSVAYVSRSAGYSPVYGIKAWSLKIKPRFLLLQSARPEFGMKLWKLMHGSFSDVFFRAGRNAYSVTI